MGKKTFTTEKINLSSIVRDDEERLNGKEEVKEEFKKMKTSSFVIEAKRYSDLRIFAAKNGLAGVGTVINKLIDKFYENETLNEEKMKDFLNN